MEHRNPAYIINVEGGTGHPIITPSESVGNSTAGDKLSTLTHYHLIIMWDEIMDMPGEIFDMGDGSFMTEEDIAEGQRLLDAIDADMSLTFNDIVEGMANDPEFVAQCERNNAQWDEEAAAELGVTVDELRQFMEV